MLVIAVVVGPLSAHAGQSSAPVAPSLAGTWEGAALEYQGIYSGPAGATVRLDLKSDGTFTETWKDGARQWTTSGTWRTKGRSVVLSSADRSHARLTLRHKGNDLYGVAMEPLPNGRTTTTSIDLHSVS